MKPFIDIVQIEQNTKIKKVFYLKTVTSTNDWGKEFLKKRFLFRRKESQILSESGNAEIDSNVLLDTETDVLSELPVLVLSEEQTSGRGRDNHQWWSPQGMLAFTLIARWDFFQRSRRDSSEFSQYTAEILAETIIHELISQRNISSPIPLVRMIPPNDIYVEEKKISGILIESPDPEHLLIGIGVNLNNSTDSAPEQLKNRLTTLFDLVKKEINVTNFLNDFLLRFLG